MCCACDATVFFLFDDSLHSQHRARTHPSRRPPRWSAPNIAPTTPLAARGDRTGKDDSLFLFANVAGGVRTTRLLFFAHLGGGSMRGPCLPANMQGWRVVWAKTAFHPPDWGFFFATGNIRAVLRCSTRGGPSNGAELVGGCCCVSWWCRGGRAAAAAVAAVVRQCWALFVFGKAPPSWGTPFFFFLQVFFFFSW